MNETIDYRHESPLHREAHPLAVRALVLAICAGCGLFGYSVGYHRGWGAAVEYNAGGGAAANRTINDLMMRVTDRPATARATD
jgi:hypothetical protein